MVEFKIAKTSKLMDITKFNIGTPVIIKTDDDIYDSYISAITLSDDNFVYFKSGSIRTTLLDKLKATSKGIGNKLDVSGGLIKGSLSVTGQIYSNEQRVLDESNIVNNLTSTSTTNVLSAKQGKVLNEKFGNYLPLSGGNLTGQIYMGENKVLSFVVTDSWS